MRLFDVPFKAEPITLNPDEQHELRQMSLSRSLPAGDVIRARMILMLAGGRSYVEIQKRFARIEREVIARDVFTSVQDLARKLMRYIRAYAKDAKPFRWKYSDVTKPIKPC